MVDFEVMDCWTCGATVTVTMMESIDGEMGISGMEGQIKCCEAPDFHWTRSGFLTVTLDEGGR